MGTAARLGRGGPGNGRGVRPSDEQTPGSLEEEKRGPTVEGRPEPQAAEVESAHLLANHAREELRAAGLSDQRIQVLADEYVALDRGQETGEFIAWARRRATT